MTRAVAILTCCLFALLPMVPAAEPLRFNRDVRPILSDNCFSCHGPDQENRKAGLRLDDREAAITPTDSGDTAIVPGNVKRSALVDRIMTEDEEDMMPPPRAHKTLTAAQKETLKRWIAEGAHYEQHWAYAPVQLVNVPSAADLPGADPALANWPQNPIDRFILQQLARRGLKPSPRAEPATLARRMALDLTGLPPGEELPANFDAEKPGAYISALFTSPHHGERMAVDWLDAARFADSKGYQEDRDQDMHHFRDWVIRAFSGNMRFDRFTVEQLAGDLLPGATPEQMIATGFNRAHRVNTEGGVIPAEFIAEYTADRVETTATVWLGQTFNCTRCHDHKYDPLTQRDFYSMKAFFNNVGEQGDGGPDTLVLASPAMEQQIAPLQRERSALEADLARRKIADADLRSWAGRLVNQRLKWEPFEIVKVGGPQGTPAASSDGRSFALGFVNRAAQPVVATVKVPAGKRITALRIECSTEADDARVDLSGVSVTTAESGRLPLAGVSEGDSIEGAVAQRLVGNHAAPPTEARSKTAAGSGTTLRPGPNRPAEALVWQLGEPFGGGTLEVAVAVRVNNRDTAWRILFSEAPPDQLVAESTIDLAAKDSAELTPAEEKKLRQEFLLTFPESADVRSKLAEISRNIEAIRRQQPSAIVMKEREKPKDTFILLRGEYDKPGEKVTPATPAILPPLPAGAPRNRLGLARWLVSPENPLTARVTVNRLWQSVFGTGLVRTSEDFGSQGELPSHPELLDWLAGEFMRSGWDVQHMLRLMLESATYRQSSRVTPELLAADPENRLLARGPRFRLHAEFVRDQALAAAGLLSEKIGGKSVKPYHPAGIYELISKDRWVQDTGEGLHRRSLYTFWKRTVPHPAMIAFDAPGREICSVRRTRSNTPLQALNLLNDPTYIEAARHLAARMIRSSPRVADQIRFGYRALLGREGMEAETAVLVRAFERTRNYFAANAGAAAGLLKTGVAAPSQSEIEPAVLAAMTSVAGTLLCLDETVTKE